MRKSERQIRRDIDFRDNLSGALGWSDAGKPKCVVTPPLLRGNTNSTRFSLGQKAKIIADSQGECVLSKPVTDTLINNRLVPALFLSSRLDPSRSRY